jgi:hypothetical protein
LGWDPHNTSGGKTPKLKLEVKLKTTDIWDSYKLGQVWDEDLDPLNVTDQSSKAIDEDLDPLNVMDQSSKATYA